MQPEQLVLVINLERQLLLHARTLLERRERDHHLRLRARIEHPLRRAHRKLLREIVAADELPLERQQAGVLDLEFLLVLLTDEQALEVQLLHVELDVGLDAHARDGELGRRRVVVHLRHEHRLARAELRRESGDGDVLCLVDGELHLFGLEGESSGGRILAVSEAKGDVQRKEAVVRDAEALRVHADGSLIALVAAHEQRPKLKLRAVDDKLPRHQWRRRPHARLAVKHVVRVAADLRVSASATSHERAALLSADNLKPEEFVKLANVVRGKGDLQLRLTAGWHDPSRLGLVLRFGKLRVFRRRRGVLLSLLRLRRRRLDDGEQREVHDGRPCGTRRRTPHNLQRLRVRQLKLLARVVRERRAHLLHDRPQRRFERDGQHANTRRRILTSPKLSSQSLESFGIRGGLLLPLALERLLGRLLLFPLSGSVGRFVADEGGLLVCGRRCSLLIRTTTVSFGRRFFRSLAGRRVEQSLLPRRCKLAIHTEDHHRELAPARPRKGDGFTISWRLRVVVQRKVRLGQPESGSDGTRHLRLTRDRAFERVHNEAARSAGREGHERLSQHLLRKDGTIRQRRRLERGGRSSLLWGFGPLGGRLHANFIFRRRCCCCCVVASGLLRSLHSVLRGLLGTFDFGSLFGLRGLRQELEPELFAELVGEGDVANERRTDSLVRSDQRQLVLLSHLGRERRLARGWRADDDNVD
mmetsp:Transcript_3055/g.11080  ORF Transcript_3055/g.11080 Transcript_3055/m.11080 type:complete len:700 (+) Transcript_3055:6013-8112(+)